GAGAFLLYMALEPYIRRRCPEPLIAWTRLLSGSGRDPMIGRDVLIGITAGLAHATLASATNWLPGRLGYRPPAVPHATNLDSLFGLRFMISSIVSSLQAEILTGFIMMVLLVAF